MNRRPAGAAVAPSSKTPPLVTAMTVAEALELGQRTLRPSSATAAQREALFLLAGTLRTDQGQLLIEKDRLLNERELGEYRERLARRARGEPLQYVERCAAFRQLSLRVDPSVLIPRPETEQLVGRVLEWCRARTALRGMDLGTGSGAIAISLAREGPFDAIVAVDISSPALNLARENAEAAGVAGIVDLRFGPFFDAVRPSERFHVIVSNPPYIASGELDSLPAEVREWEPPEALLAGPTGLEVIERIVDEAPGYLEPCALLALEVAPDLADATLELIASRGAYGKPRVERDLAGLRRIVIAETLA